MLFGSGMLPSNFVKKSVGENAPLTKGNLTAFAFERNLSGYLLSIKHSRERELCLESE